MQEIWKSISFTNGKYEVSNLGRVRSMLGVLPRILSIQNNRRYPTIGIASKTYMVHRLVAIEFLPNIDNKEQVNHIDGDKQNPSANNLQWVTHSENAIHAVLTSSISGYKKLTQEQVLDIRKNHSHRSHGNIAIEFGVTRQTIQKLLSGKSWNYEHLKI